MKNLKAKVDTRAGLGVPGRIYDIESKPQKGKPRDIAKAVLKKIAADLKINPDLSQLKFEEVKESVLGKHVLFQQQQDGKSISGAWVRVDIDNEGKVYNIQNDLVPDTVIQKAEKAHSKKSKAAVTKQLTVDEAKKIALAASGVTGTVQAEVAETELAYYQHEGIPMLAWKVVVVIKTPAAEWKYYIDAVTGNVLDRFDLLKSLDGVGKVFDPNPVVRLNNTHLEDTSKIPDAAYVEVKLQGLSKSGLLDGPFVSTKRTPKRVKQTNLKFNFKREERAFKEVMVYFHIDRMQRYIQELGFKNIINRPIEVNIDGTKDDNSFYSPTSKSLTFGTGGVDDAEDAEIILHEYGHAMQDSIVPGFGPAGEARAMGEGFGDYIAASFFANVKPTALKPTVGNWDAVAYSGDEPPALRRLDSNKKYPKDMTGEEHNDGEIWSACLWEIRAAIGGKQADKLIIAHHFLVSPKAKFEDAAKALITTDKNMNKGVNEKMIRDVFIKRGIMPNAKRKNKRAGVAFEDTGKTNK
jgi:Fungalysin metallopeptidase (M36)/Peptidase propeptide and YPEB domain